MLGVKSVMQPFKKFFINVYIIYLFFLFCLHVKTFQLCSGLVIYLAVQFVPHILPIIFIIDYCFAYVLRNLIETKMLLTHLNKSCFSGTTSFTKINVKIKSLEEHQCPTTSQGYWYWGFVSICRHARMCARLDMTLCVCTEWGSRTDEVHWQEATISYSSNNG